MNPENPENPSYVLEKDNDIPHYLQIISAEDSLLQNYRGLFLAIQGAFFAIAFVLGQGGSIGYVKNMAKLGIAFGVLWIIVCCHRGSMIDNLKGELKDLMENNTASLKGWYAWAYGKESNKCLMPSNMIRSFSSPLEKFIPRVSFNLVFPLILIVLWGMVLGDPQIIKGKKDEPKAKPCVVQTKEMEQGKKTL